jgi:hypothetical protein
MALKIDFPLAGGVVAAGAYVIAHRLMRDRLTGQIMGEAWVYGSEIARRKAEQMLREHRNNMAAFHAAQKALNEIASEKLDFPIWDADRSYPDKRQLDLAIEAHNSETKRIQDEYDARLKPAQAAFEAARDRAAASELALSEPAAKPVRVFGFEIPPEQAEDMGDASGNADPAKVYAWLKAQPPLAGSEDA